MSGAARRGWAAAGTVAIAAAVNVATGMLTQHWAAAWWAATAVLVVVGGALQAWLTIADRGGDDAPGARTAGVGGDDTGIVSTGDGATNVQMRAEASGHGRVYQSGGDQTFNER